MPFCLLIFSTALLQKVRARIIRDGTKWSKISTFNCYDIYFRGNRRQFSENICSADDLRFRIFGTFHCKIPCLPASPRIFEHVKKWYNCPFLTDFYP